MGQYAGLSHYTHRPGGRKSVQQFYGEGGGFLVTTQNSLWLAEPTAGKLLRLDTRRIAATLAE